MKRSIQNKIIFAGTITGLIFSFVIYITIIDSNPTPKIQGVVLAKPLKLTEFELRDHKDRQFTDRQLQGKWHFVSYGYMRCPDICPTTLATISQLTTRLKKQAFIDDAAVIFYTVDPLRDTSALLAQYVNFFGSEFVGIRPGDNPSFKAFEKTLGIKYVLTADNNADTDIDSNTDNKDSDNYNVSHGLTIALLNPEANLQAVFEPSIDPFGNADFSVDQLYRDYMLIRNYYHSSL